MVDGAKIMYRTFSHTFNLDIDQYLALKRLIKSLQLIMNTFVLEEYETANDKIKDDELLMLAGGGSEWYLYLNG